jgi:hypothetical protein
MKDYYTEQRLKRLKEITLDVLLEDILEQRDIPEKLLKVLMG